MRLAALVTSYVQQVHVVLCVRCGHKRATLNCEHPFALDNLEHLNAGALLKRPDPSKHGQVIAVVIVCAYAQRLDILDIVNEIKVVILDVKVQRLVFVTLLKEVQQCGCQS